ncbi:unnamed protein product, partial [Allacma fusca]
MIIKVISVAKFLLCLVVPFHVMPLLIRFYRNLTNCTRLLLSLPWLKIRLVGSLTVKSCYLGSESAYRAPLQIIKHQRSSTETEIQENYPPGKTQSQPRHTG